MEPWEALDVDDSDLPTLLRPCKRQHQPPNPINPDLDISYSQSILQPCSRLLSHPQLTPKTPSQTLDSQQSQLSLRQLHDPHTPTASPRLIPGPAGAVQAAMFRKTRDNQNSCRGSGGEDTPISTQEYIRRAVEVGSEDDDDFKRNPWLCALEFLGVVDGVLPSISLSSIKKCLNIGQVDQVVGVIKSCTSNGLGDLMVTMKDPTGTIGASIHHKVFSEGEFGKDISVGSVLILQKVAVFVPSQSAHYLNITLSNVVKFFENLLPGGLVLVIGVAYSAGFCTSNEHDFWSAYSSSFVYRTLAGSALVIHKDSGPPLKQTYLASTIKYTVHNTECSPRGTGMQQKTFSLQMERTEGIMDKIRQYPIVCSAHNDRQMEKENSPPASTHCSRGNSRNQYAAVEEWPSVRKDAAKEAIEKSVRIDITDDRQKDLDGIDKCTNAGNQSFSNQKSSAAANMVEDHNNEETRRINGVERQRQPLVSRKSLPQWTDEQLNELCAMDFEDDGALF